jgi:lysophospholipase L1-like esterase
MKKLPFLFALAAFCCCAAPVNTVKLQLPPAIYAVPGVESSIYFDNIVRVINPANYVFDVTCDKGRNDQKRWRYIPKAGEKGTYDLKITVISDRGIEAEASTKLIVTPAETGKGKNFAVLIIGDSLTAASVYPRRLYELLKNNGHPQVKFLGLNGKAKSEAGHEGYGGWTWASFMDKKTATPVKKGQPTFPRNRPSPFIHNGKFSLTEYLKKHHGGRMPDFITIQLGVNDVFGGQDATLNERIARILGNADRLLGALRKEAPNAIIGVGLVTPSASTQDAFGSNYTNGQTRWQYKKNQHALNEAMLKKFANYPDKKVFLIPTNVNLDCENNYPVRREAVDGVNFKGNKRTLLRQSNGVHPAPAGYNQMGDTFYCWIKYQLSR